MKIFQITVTAEDTGLYWIVDSFFLDPPGGVIPDNDTMPPDTMYYSRSTPTWNGFYKSHTIVVYCKQFKPGNTVQTVHFFLNPFYLVYVTLSMLRCIQAGRV